MMVKGNLSKDIIGIGIDAIHYYAGKQLHKAMWDRACCSGLYTLLILLLQEHYKDKIRHITGEQAKRMFLFGSLLFLAGKISAHEEKHSHISGLQNQLLWDHWGSQNLHMEVCRLLYAWNWRGDVVWYNFPRERK